MAQATSNVRPRLWARSSLSLRITVVAVLYMFLLSLAVVFHGNRVNERAEGLLWEALLETELQRYQTRRAEDPDYRWHGERGVVLFGTDDSRPLPAALAQRGTGMHDEIRLDGARYAVLIVNEGGRRIAIGYDITRFEDEERHLSTVMIGSALGGMLLASVLIALVLRRMVRPLQRMADDIAHLQPDDPAQRVHARPGDSRELQVIATALNGYLQRNERYVERERDFINTSSHELRTPVAVIAGASALALEHPQLPPVVRAQLERIAHSAHGVEQLVALLLMLARDPQRLAAHNERMRLDELLPRIVDDHLHLAADKDLQILLAPLPPCMIDAPPMIVQAALGNLLRNAIENSDRGVIRIVLEDDAVVSIEDPGHGMSPQEISALYARMARAGAGRGGGGIGLELIARLCEHLGWRLEFTSVDGRGTRARLDLGSNVAPADR